MSPPAVLASSGLAKDYGDGFGLHPVDLALGAGELVVLVGPNGAGKSTLIGLCAGLLEPTEGTVTVAGQAAGSLGARAATSYLPDTPVLYDDLSVREHLEYVARLHGVDDWQGGAEELLARLDLEDRADDLPSRFSRGMRQKVSLALALIRPFDLLLVDEPFVGLDAPSQATLVELLIEAVAGGACALVSTHQLDLADEAGRCLGLRDGELVHDGGSSRDMVRALVTG
ncbi:MAG: ABC transporter ATP-binding protein [Actinomycetota bacterium]|nr:ABC transporter ATP-binding protein [Actinomycetota bacterium]